jgi:hypothetical protein
MATKKRRKPSRKAEDANETAFAMMNAISDDDKPGQTAQAERKTRKNPAAVALGRRGGLKGGSARAKSLTPEERQAIASKAAKARWGKRDPSK